MARERQRWDRDDLHERNDGRHDDHGGRREGKKDRHEDDGNRHDGRDATRLTVDDVTLFVGGDRRDRYEGSANMDAAFGRGGNDRLNGDGMGDDLQGGAGDDRLTDDAGMDHLDGGDGDDRLVSGAEGDALRGGKGKDHLDEGAGHGDLEGGEGDDVLVGGPGGDAFAVSPDSGHDVVKDFAAGPGMLDHIALRDIAPEELRFEDTKAGVRISWNEGEGSVLLEGVFKRDLAPDDFMFAADRQVIRPTDADADRVTAEKFIRDEGDAAAPPAIPSDTPAEETFPFDEFLVKFGGDGNDAFRGTEARDYFIGLGGGDQFSGGAGDDDLWGGEGDDVLVGEAGQDDLKGGAGEDKLFGGDQADSIMGEEGRDSLYAGAGHDMLMGEQGDDTLDGGDGADAFVVGPDTSNDVVVGGFDAGPGAFDHIALRGITPEQVTVADTTRDGSAGVLVSWNTDADADAEGSIFLVGLTKGRMAQDDFMFNAEDGLEGDFVDDPAITAEGSRLIFQDGSTTAADDQTTTDWMI